MVRLIYLKLQDKQIAVWILLKEKLSDLKNIEDYIAIEAQKDYYKKRKKCIKKLPEFTEEQLNFIHLRFNAYHDSPAEIIQRFLIKFGIKFPVCVKIV
ncbi:transposase of is30 family protein [Spiroplasma phoeniceum P40]|uniref:Transposase of is30 family protein n=1 Tax=Spiroplasma phoeniceum P40 TaxID=1276259 RepID=A0A345DS53_9MOLU|nr:transposase of is30 family protein [Spiroplasma phoeniceum P40]